LDGLLVVSFSHDLRIRLAPHQPISPGQRRFA
jgi:hypothetical protein